MLPTCSTWAHFWMLISVFDSWPFLATFRSSGGSWPILVCCPLWVDTEFLVLLVHLLLVFLGNTQFLAGFVVDVSFVDFERVPRA